MKGYCINLLEIQEKLDDDKIYDICLNEEFEINTINSEIIEYILFPPNVMIEDLLDPSETFKILGNDFLKDNKEYLTNLKKSACDIKIQLQQIHDLYLKDLKDSTDQEVYDTITLRFYPKKLKIIENIYESLIKDINDKFFTPDSKFDPIDQSVSNILAFKILGISDSNFDVTDEDFINCLKRKWFKLIMEEKKSFFNNLKNVDLSEFSEEEKEEYYQELDALKDYLNEIKITDMENFKTVKEIISYWPSILQPKPFFVYEN
jgi:hypothetical protein